MAGSETGEDLFVWDETTHLYFHSRSGFYHDPEAGWYYSTNDGFYYKFDNGSYVLWDSQQDRGCENNTPGSDCAVEVASHDPSVEISCPNGGRDYSSNCFSIGDGDFAANAYALDNGCDMECSQYSNQDLGLPPPPSEWYFALGHRPRPTGYSFICFFKHASGVHFRLEETLINNYLSGCNSEIDPGDDSAKLWPMTSENSFNVSVKEGETSLLEPGELVKKDCIGSSDQTVGIKDEDLSQDELNWLAQYGQVVNSSDEPRSEMSTMDLWDWSMVKSTRKGGKDVPARLLGRLTKSATKLHPSMPPTSSLVRTAPITKVHLDLVRVRTGKVYKLRTPSARYLASLTSYDSSNPTKDWVFSDFSFVDDVGKEVLKPSDEGEERNTVSVLPNNVDVLQMNGNVYRDRAAERRKLHGSFGLGPGQKNMLVGGSEFPISSSTEEAAAEALNMSLGAGSYAQKILKSMGWKEGEALGSSSKGLIEPLQVAGNIASAGLGWPHNRQRLK